MSEIQRPGALYRQVAAAIRDAIASGEYPPGAPLPSEAQLIERYQVSRPTVRNAVAALRSEGLLEVIHGKGSFVRGASSPVVTIDRSVSQDDGGAFTTEGAAEWEEVEEPHIYRTHTNAVTGPQLGLREDEALFGVDRLLIDTTTATRVLHQTLIPFATAEGTDLAEHPGTEPARIYALLAAAGHTLWWSETVRARMPLPDERTSLQLQDATPLLETTRVTHGTKDHPLILEVLRTSADRAQLAYRITPDPTPKLRATRT
ncbi:GntR family transcriptional regulator [Actinacidiphila bryophytorum]|uniref:GntR family transcriptional regulator n=1 Tax=Actinacidiphila bryophytorum TaxID=1436133 RepID=A0A9W4E771_9ACTN|nr:GntR family transcriptional regulator [Actinacidiphila bryophytorum]MBM9436061.1 GntR family transcriptional regulator [Actinacidiphila bryophytorum]MBN6542139.1 GntR family transcriptional regulator [Actinacidiphila bryophytorum]CAG7634828.1 GntR family transcriptional regulator [Actinacidiphila bryophytorum]